MKKTVISAEFAVYLRDVVREKETTIENYLSHLKRTGEILNGNEFYAYGLSPVQLSVAPIKLFIMPEFRRLTEGTQDAYNVAISHMINYFKWKENKRTASVSYRFDPSEPYVILRAI